MNLVWYLLCRVFSKHLVLLLFFFFLADKVVIVSYNILGVENASKHPDLYSKVPLKFIEWERRKKLIRNEIDQYNASILCLQVSVGISYSCCIAHVTKHS